MLAVARLRQCASNRIGLYRGLCHHGICVSAVPIATSGSELKHVLCQIDGNGTSIYFGLLSSEQLIPKTMLTRALQFGAKEWGESIPSVKGEGTRPKSQIG